MKITIQRALNELNVLKSRIEKQIANLTPLDIIQKNKKDTTITTKQTASIFTQNAKSSMQSITDLITQRENIKNKIISANNTIQITLNNQQYTIAQLLAKKESINLKANLAMKLKTSYERTISQLNSIEYDNEDKIQELLNKMKTDKSKEQEMKSLYQNLLTLEQATLIDPCDILTTANLLEEEVDLYNNEINFLLSEANNTNHIEI